VVKAEKSEGGEIMTFDRAAQLAAYLAIVVIAVFVVLAYFNGWG
jgi:hypothetical protein